MKKITMFFIIITIVAAFPVLCYTDAKNVEVKEEPQYLETARAVLEQYYKNKDLREKNDFSNLVSKEVCKLLNAKIEMEQFQNEMLDIIYNDYKIEIIPVKIDSWTVGKNRTSMFLQVKRSWIYSENDERTTSSELQNVTVVKKGNSFIAEECYEEYENITLGPIDRVYRESISLKENTDTKIKKYIEDFKRNCLEKKEKQMCDVQEGELITNQKDAKPTDEPGKKPDKPDKPDTNKPTTPKTNTDNHKETPKTGGTSNMYLYALMMLTSGALFATVVYRRKKYAK